MTENLGAMICGIGLFFVGLKWLTETLKQVAGRRFRLFFSKWTGTLPKAGAVGFASGFVFQSMSALSFILASLVSSGLIRTRNASMAIIWGNVGVGIIIFIAVLNIKTLILFVIGIAGICMVFERPKGALQLMRVLFGIGLLYFGLVLLNQGAAPLAELDFFKRMLLQSGSVYVLVFAFGALLTALCQSSTAVTILAIALAQAGLFDVQQTIMVIYGANVGSSAVTWLLSTHLRGRPRQLVMCQAFFNFIAAGVFVPLFFLEEYGGVPLVRALVESGGAPLEQQMAYVYLLFNLGGALFASLFFKPYHVLLERLWPPTHTEQWTRLKYLHDHALADTSVAVVLLVREQNALLRHLLRYMAVIREAESQESRAKLSAIEQAYEAVSKEITAFSRDILSHRPAYEVSELTLNVENIQRQLDVLNAILGGFAASYASISTRQAADFQDIFVESLDFIMLETSASATNLVRDDLEYLLQLTAERGETFQKLRKVYLSRQAELSPPERELLLHFSSLFERAVWTVNRMALLLMQRAVYDLAKSPHEYARDQEPAEQTV